MSQPEEARAHDDDVQNDSQQKIIVDDPEDFAKTRQLRAIFDARDDYIQARREANRQMEEGKIEFTDRNRRVFRHLQDLAMTMEPLLKSYDGGREIWKENTYGVDGNFCAPEQLLDFLDAKRTLEEICDSLPSEGEGSVAKELLDEYEERVKTEYSSSWKMRKIKARIITAATPWGWEIQGLGNLIKKTHRLKYKKTNPGKSFFGTTPPVQEISDDAFRDLQDFIRQIGLGVRFDEEQQTKINDDLLQEVDEWRRQNV